MDIIDEKSINYQTGDVIIVKSFEPIGMGVRYLESKKLGGLTVDHVSHIEGHYGDGFNMSAEDHGASLEKTGRYGDAEYWVYRLKMMTDEKKSTFRSLVAKYYGIKYAFSRYKLDALNLVSFCGVLLAIWASAIAPFFGANGWWILKWIASPTAALLVFGLVVKPILIKRDLMTMDCSELMTVILFDIGLWSTTGGARNASPTAMKQTLDTLVLNGAAELIAHVPRRKIV